MSSGASASWSATTSRSSATLAGGPDALARIVRDRASAARCCGARADDTDPVRARHRRQRRPARHRHRAGRPRAPAAADRPLPRRRLRRRPRPAARPDQGRPRRPDGVPRHLHPARGRARRDRRAKDGGLRRAGRRCASSSSGRVSRARRPLRRRQEHPGQRAGARTPSARPAIVNDTTGRGRHTSTYAVALPRCPTATTAGSSTRPASARSDSPTSTSTGSSTTSPTSPRAPTTALAAAPTTRRSARLDAWVAAGHAGPAGASRLESLRRLLRARSGESGD